MPKPNNRWQVRIAPSLGGGFAGTPYEAWGVKPYTDKTEPCVFFGMYGMRDLQAFFYHEGEAAILWAGSDIRNFLKGYWLDKHGNEKIPMEGIYTRFSTVPNYVENAVEYLALASVGITAEIVPSFLGKVDDFQPQMMSKSLRYYTSVSGDEFELYGWDEISDWADRYPTVEFHLYGNTKDLFTIRSNVHVHGRVPQEQMDAETMSMTGALRLTRFDGFSEILAKSVLWGQSPVSPYIQYPFIAQEIGQSIPNARQQFLEVVNKYPFCVQDN